MWWTLTLALGASCASVNPRTTFEHAVAPATAGYASVAPVQRRAHSSAPGRELPRGIDDSVFSWPVDPVAVTSDFGRRLHPIFGSWRFHTGVDLYAEPYQRVAAAGAGVVVFAGWHGAYGKHVEVQHADSLVTRYSHLATVLVKIGEVVENGDAVGLAGDTGQATGVHVHFEVRRNGYPIDPTRWIGSHIEGHALRVDGPPRGGTQLTKYP